MDFNNRSMPKKRRKSRQSLCNAHPFLQEEWPVLAEYGGNVCLGLFNPAFIKNEVQGCIFARLFHLNLISMKSFLRAFAFATLLIPTLTQAQEGKKVDIEVSGAVLKTAEWANFKYMENLDKAQGGDQKAIKAFLEFSGAVDGVEALQHATACIELIPYTKDERFGSVVSTLKPKLKAALLSRFQLAQGRTKKTELLRPMQEWAPFTWKALNGENVVCNSCIDENGISPTKASGPAQKAPSMQATEASQDSGKQ